MTVTNFIIYYFIPTPTKKYILMMYNLKHNLKTKSGISILILSFVISAIVITTSTAYAAAPTMTWIPTNNGYINEDIKDDDITIDFGQEIFYNKAECDANTTLTDINARKLITPTGFSGAITYGSNVITIDPTNDFASSKKSISIKGKKVWYKDSDASDACKSESIDNFTSTVDTIDPTVTYDTKSITGGIKGVGDDTSTTYLNEGDSITVTMTFSELIQKAPKPTIQFTTEDGSNVGELITAEGNDKSKKWTAKLKIPANITVASDALKYELTNTDQVLDLAGNAMAAEEEQDLNNIEIDTTKPTVATADVDSSDDANGDWAIEGETITVTVDFDEPISERNTSIKYRIGTSSDKKFSFVSRDDFLSSGECQGGTNDTYTCKYEVPARVNGLFQVRVSEFEDRAGNEGLAQASYNTDGITVDTKISAPTAISLIPKAAGSKFFKDGVIYRGNETEPTFRVTVGEGVISGSHAGTVTLYSDDACLDPISEPVEVTDKTSPFYVSVDTNEYSDDGSDDGLKTVYAKHTDAAGNPSSDNPSNNCSTAFERYYLDTVGPSVNDIDTAYYSDNALTTEINADDKISSGSDIYTKVVFDEKIERPVLFYRIGGDDGTLRQYGNTKYTAVASLRSRQCMPNNASNISDTYICRHTVRSTDSGEFVLIVKDETKDLVGEKLVGGEYTHEDSIHLDNQAPAKPTDLDLEEEDDSGDDSEDDITNETSGLTITGCAEEDSTVALYDNGTAISGATETADGSGCNITGSEFTIDIDLTEGKHKITAKATDGYSNTSSASKALTITIDTTAPTATISGAPTTGTKKVEDLDVAVAGRDVTHYKYKVLNGTSCASVNFDDEEIDVKTNKNIEEGIDINDGATIFCVIGRDKTGNWQTAANATNATWTQDMIGPAKPTNLDLAEADDTGLLATDNITKKTSGLTITGCAEADSTVTLSIDDAELGGTVTANGTTGCIGTLKQFTKDVTLTEGDHKITAKAVDASDNELSDPFSDPLTIIIKSVAPSITATNLDLAAADDSGKDDDDITKTKTDLTISGTLSSHPDTGDYIQLYDGTTLLTGAKDSTFANGTDWSIDIDLASEGAHTIGAKVHDVAGNEGTATSMKITIDTTGPTVSITKNVTSPTTDLTPNIKIRTSDAGTVSFGGACADKSENPTEQEVTAGDNTVTLPTLENKTYDDCTVIVTDVTGNLSSGTKMKTFIVDNTPPGIASATFENVTRTKTTVTLNERVYAPTTPLASDFQVEINGVVYADFVTGISGIGRSKARATQSFTLTHTALPATGVKIRYTKGTNHIFDQIGNTLESSIANDNTAITVPRFIALTLDAADDTGRDSDDGLTRFDGNDVTITVSLADGSSTFKNGERVRVFVGTNTQIGYYTVSTVRGSRFVQADGQTSFTITVPKSKFKVGVNTLSATYTGIGLGQFEGSRGGELSITYDTTNPRVNVRNSNTSKATQKVVSAKDGDATEETVWQYKVLTELVEICNEAQMATGATDYTEGDDITFTKTTDNGSRVCFSSKDAAGNTAYSVSSTLGGIDGEVPTVKSVVTSSNGAAIRVTLSEPVYAATAPSLSDFRVIAVTDNVEHSIQGISGLGRSSSAAKDSFVITLPFTAPTTQMTLKYTPGVNRITDVIGNNLASFDGQAISRVKIASLTLDAADDTGSDTTDQLTRFDGDTVNITVTPSEGVFANGDMVRIFVGNSATSVRSYTVSQLSGTLYKNIAGNPQFTAELPRSAFTEGVNNLYATYKPYGKSEERGEILAITYDNTKPAIEIVIDPTTAEKAKQKMVYASDSETTETVWQYKQMTGTTECEDATMTDATTYIESSKELVFKQESDNDTKVCFSATDKAGNSTYKASERLSGIDITAPIISSASITSTTRNATKVIFSEPIYAASTVNPRDFIITSGNRQYTVTGITGLASNSTDAKEEIILNHIAIRETDTVTLRYVKSGNGITDAAGNLFENLTVSVANKPFAILELDTQDDTGINTGDGITAFDGDEVSFVVSITSGTFAERDQIYIYEKGKTSALQAIEVPSTGVRFTTTIEKKVFKEGTITVHVGHIPEGSFEETMGTEFSFTYDKTAPNITVVNPGDTVSAMKKQVSASDDDTGTTAWTYQVIDNNTKCDAVSMSSGTTEYTEKNVIDVEEEGANEKKVCFAATDVAGNTGYEVSEKIEGVDTTAPTVTSAIVENYERTRTVVTFSESVYAASGSLSTSDFRIAISGTGYSQAISSIENLPTALSGARTTLVFTHPSMSEQIGSTLIYTKGTHTLTDTAGNTVDSFEQSVANTSFVILNLADKDDTGKDKDDNYTRFDGSTVTLVVSLTNNAQFSNGDVVTIYSGNNRNTVKTIKISSYAADDSVSADGARSFTVAVSKSIFAENGITSLSAAYAPYGTIGINKVGGVLRVTADTEAPDITVSPLSTSPASSKSVSAVDGDNATDDTTAITDWMSKRIKSGVVCESEAMKQGAEEYAEGTDLSFENEGDNNTKMCFSATDLAGNVTYKESDEIVGIDTNAPTVSNVAVTSDDTVTVTMSEGVYSKIGPDTDDFVVFVNDTAAITESVTGIQNTIGKVRNQFTITIAGAFEVNDAVSISYIQSTTGDAMIKDATDKALASFDKIVATLPTALTITLDSAYDTGVSDDDGLTGFGDSTDVGIVVALNSGVFKDGDKIRIYRNNEGRVLTTITIGIRPNEVNARGDGSFTAMIPKSSFAEGSFTLHATYAPRSGAEGLPSTPLTIIYDLTAPNVNITNPTIDIAQQKEMSAKDGDAEGMTEWTYKQVAKDAVCDAAQMTSETTDYTEEATLTFEKEADNETKVCFAVTDTVENTTYKASDVLTGIDSIASTITITNPDISIVSSNKKVRATDTEDVSLWVYQQVDGAATCDDATLTATIAYAENTDLIFSKESDNGTKVCFVSIDAVGNSAVDSSVVLANISESASVITVTTNQWIDPAQKDDPTVKRVQAKAVAGSDGNDTVTEWFSKQIAGDAVCNASVKESATPYIEGTPIILKKESDNGTKICFISIDQEGVVSVAASEIVVGVDTTGPVIEISKLTTDPAQKKIVSAIDGDIETETDWTSKQIANNANCDVTQMTTGAEKYTEGAEISFESEDDNSSKICFSVTDAVGNTSYAVSIVLEGIDATSPTTTVLNPDISIVSSNKKVRATDTEDVSLWVYQQVDGAATCDDATLTATIAYAENTDLIFSKESDNGTKVCFVSIDAVGNIAVDSSVVLANIKKNASAITITTNPWIDLAQVTDPTIKWVQAKAIVGKDESDVPTEWFSRQIAGDAVCDASVKESATPYIEGTPIILKKESDNGTKICFISIDQEGVVSATASEIVVGIDTTGPVIEISKLTTDPAQKKIVSAIDGDIETETDWTSKQIANNANCDVTQMTTGAEKYTEGAEISFESEDDNSSKICFSVTDAVGNTSYAVSIVLEGIDATSPTTTVLNPDVSVVSHNKKVSAIDGESVSLWKYQQVDGTATCNAATLIATTPYIEGSDLVFDKESDNGTKVCFISVDAVGNSVVDYSVVLANISESASVITVTTNQWIDPAQKDDPTVKRVQAKAVAGSDGNDTVTEWFSKQVAGDAVCDISVKESATPYIEGTPIILKKESDNGTKICFISIDQEGVVSVAASEIVVGVDTTIPTIIITDKAESVSARDADVAESVWTYKKIAGDAVCDTSQMTSGVQTYTEGKELALDKASDNGTKVCFSVTDPAGNSSYKASKTLSTITVTTNTWIDPIQKDDPTVKRVQAKAVAGSDGNDTVTEWFSKQVAGDAVCDISVKESATPYIEGTPIILKKESDNGTKICFISIDQEGVVSATASEIVVGIDVTAPTINITDLTTDPAQKKVVSAEDYDTNKTVWTYKQIASTTDCNANQMSSNAQPYVESVEITFAKESDNGTKVCFSVTDSADNTVYKASDEIVGIDATTPTVSSATLIDVDRAQTKVVVTDRVGTFGTFSANSFEIEIDGVGYPVKKISSFTQSVHTRESSFIITHASIVQGVSATLSYLASDNGGIADSVGNTLESFNGLTIFDKAFVALSLDTKDDTGLSTTDGITQFDGESVTLIAAISEGAFSNGDMVRLYKKGTPAQSLKEILISSGIVNAVNADGEVAFEIVIPKTTFAANEQTVLYTVFIPTDGSNDAGQKGSEFAVSYRATAPNITVTTSAVSAAMATVRASDGNNEGETMWQYEQIAGDEECTADTLTEASVYKESDEISFTDEKSNNTKACFASVDLAGNTSYATSDVIVIDLTAPAITVQPLTDTPEQAKIVRANDNDDGETVLVYRVLKASVACDAGAMNAKTKSYKEGSGLKFNKERANGYKICFSSTDTAGNVLYAESMTIQGIDATAPKVTVTMKGDKEKVVRATDTDTVGSTAWKYRVIKNDVSCTAETIKQSARFLP